MRLNSQNKARLEHWGNGTYFDRYSGEILEREGEELGEPKMPEIKCFNYDTDRWETSSESQVL